MCSLELWGRVTVSLEGTVDNIGSLVHKVWHDGLVHGAVPWDVSWFSHSVSVDYLVVLVEDWGLSSSPLSMGVWDWWVSWENSAEIPPVEIWVVQESSLVEAVIVEHNGSLVSKTPTNSSRHKEDQISPGNPASNVEVFNWKLPDHS